MLLWQTGLQKVLPLSLSDRDCVMCVHKINYQNIPFRTITYRDYSKDNHKVLAWDIKNYDWNPIYTEINVNTVLDYMEQGLTTIINRHATKITKHVKGCKCSCYHRKLKGLWTLEIRYSEWLEKQIKNVTGQFIKDKQNYKATKAKQNNQKDLLFENRNKPTKFWNCIKEVFL